MVFFFFWIEGKFVLKKKKWAESPQNKKKAKKEELRKKQTGQRETKQKTEPKEKVLDN